jgi:hypothetical protein
LLWTRLVPQIDAAKVLDSSLAEEAATRLGTQE